jgi:hypothetical protein
VRLTRFTVSGPCCKVKQCLTCTENASGTACRTTKDSLKRAFYDGTTEWRGGTSKNQGEIACSVVAQHGGVLAERDAVILPAGETMKLIAMVALVLWVGGAGTALAGTVTLTDWTTGDFAINAPNGGGAFKATTSGGPLGVSAFMTFCLEFNEHFSYNGTYDYELSNSAKLGGVAGGNPDPISDATRWLYFNAIKGTHAALVTAVGGALNYSGQYFQEAIWYLEQERTSGQIHAKSLALAQNAALAVAGGAWTNLAAQGHRVFAMNLTKGTTPQQDQLAYGVPDAGTTLTLLGLALTGMGLVRRSKRRPFLQSAIGSHASLGAPVEHQTREPLSRQ